MPENKYGRGEFIEDDVPAELPDWKYGVDDSKTMYDPQNGQRAAALKSPYAIYLIALAAFMLFWFAYSFINAVKKGGGIKVLLSYLPSFFALGVCVVIILLSVFGMWGKFARWAFKKKAVAGNPEANRIKAEIEAADANKGKENALNIFEDYIEVVNFGVRTVLNRALLRNVILKKCETYYVAEFVSVYGQSVLANAGVPAADVYKIKEIFGNACEVEKRKPPIIMDGRVYRDKEKFEIGGVQIGGLVMGLICAAAGAGVIAMHYCVDKRIPMPLGLFFIVGGVLATLTAFSNIAAIKVFAIPLLFGIIFTGFPFMFAFSVAQSEEVKVVLPTFHEFLCSFSPLGCGFFFLAALGVLLIIHAFINLFKLIIYGS